ncbi:hypothetical protein [Phenylobacterium sp.]|uniref:hypothetical protein n=1 Tax=Phenylobacterium sp. TaxID=1871053 RepID=UPI0035B18EF1
MHREAVAPRQSANRSAISNGSRVLIGVDGRSAGARRYRDIVEDLSREIGGDLSAAELLQVRNAATLQVLAEDLAAAQARGEAVDAEALTRAANGATRALAALRRLRPAAKAKRKVGLSDVLAARRMAAE